MPDWNENVFDWKALGGPFQSRICYRRMVDWKAPPRLAYIILRSMRGVCVCLRGGAAAAGRQEGGVVLALYASLSSKRGCNFLFLFFFFFLFFLFFSFFSIIT